MSLTTKNILHVIIAGAAKAATSSVFSYLSDHPEICGSSVKETAFFEKHCTGVPNIDRALYSKFFRHCKNHAHIFVEASAGYFTCNDKVLKTIDRTLPDVRLLFILRNPVDRLYSYYNFQVAQLRIPDRISFDEFAHMSLQYCEHGTSPQEMTFEKRHLVALRVGRYAEHLERFIRIFGIDRMRVMFYEDLAKDPRRFMLCLSDFLHINPSFYGSYQFNRSNVTFASRIKVLHRIALWTNAVLERHLRQRSRVKKMLVSSYKYFNENKTGHVTMSETVRKRLEAYYAPSIEDLRALPVAGNGLPSWTQRHPATENILAV